MIKPNWDIFKTKFSENPQNYFEWFSYLLFCKEFNRNYGIFRYINQSAIETNPIDVDNNIIGWQAKFYDTSLSNHKDDFINTLNKATRDYPSITKLIFYSNQEWGQNKGKKPQGLLDVEEKADEHGIELLWNCGSFFESPFVCVDNNIFAKHFFSLDKSIFNVIDEQQKHSKNILREIKTSISFNDQNFEIDRSNYFELLKETNNKITIISGAGGVGKTVFVKKLYEQLKEIPFYVFKATEFDLNNINNLYDNFSFYDFIEAHQHETNKIVVIDSSEKLLDLKNSDPFKEFLSVLIKDKWKIIFTTRDNYLENLNSHFFDIYQISPLNIRVNNLELDELSVLSEKHSFSLPKDEKLLELIRNPFYLNEYLQFHNDRDTLNYGIFKNKLWNTNIKKSNPTREQCFLKIAFERSNNGQFFINPSCESNILDNELVNDGILGYETAGYFITHDIYEEWALEKIIETEFLKKSSELDFFEKIGQSLPIRRSFRNWLSEQLLLKNNEIIIFIEEVIDNTKINSFWKDEILVSVLLSNYSQVFFDLYKNELLSKDQEILKKLTSILKIACKEVDDSFFTELGIKKLNLFSLKYVLTKPKGQGWESLIKFVFDNLDIIGIDNINFILPLIHDWNNKTKEGETTRLASLIALQYYQWIVKDNVYFSYDYTNDNLLQTIFYGSLEIKCELKEILGDILENRWKDQSDPYYDFSKTILTKIDGIPVSKVLPENVLKLANLFWSFKEENNDSSYYSHREVEQYFGLESTHSDYSTASAYRTPIYWLLHHSFKATIDFILNFTNRSVQIYATSGFDDNVQKVAVFFDDEVIQNQFISHCLWNMFRGTGSLKSPYLLQSIHMALEKYFLEIGEKVESSTLENWLLYLIKNSESASISAVVSSIVIAYPEKTFNVAKVLFKTKEFLLHDTARITSDLGAKSLYSIGQKIGATVNEFYDNERIETCEDKHRKFSLDKRFLLYQYFKTEETTEETANDRQTLLWGILDEYYQQLPKNTKETDFDKNWRIFLARMDRRKINITTEKTDEGVAIKFDSVLESDLKKHQKKILSKNSDFMKYNSLKMWADYKFSKNIKHMDFIEYENNPQLALQEVKEINDILNIINSTDSSKMQPYENESFLLFNDSIPAYVCSILLRDYIDEITSDDKSFCRDIILEAVAYFISSNYQYQVTDGVEQAISVLPIILKVFPDEKDNVKLYLLLSLFNEHSRGGFAPIRALKEMWLSNFKDAHSLLLGYLLLKPKYDELIIKIRNENYKKNIYDFQENQLLNRFLKDYEIDLQNIIENKMMFSNLKDIEDYDLSILKTSFQLIPKKTDNNDHKKIIKIIISVFAENLLSNSASIEIDYNSKHDFLKTYAYFVLNSHIDDIHGFLSPFLDNFNISESIADLFEEFILAEDILDTYDNFWLVWNLFKEKVIEICKDGDQHRYVDKIVKSYLFSKILWQDTAKEWHSLKDSDKRFFKDISKKIGHCPSTLYSISKLLNDIGSHYINDGVFWISTLLSNNQDFRSKKLEVNTIYYIENLVKSYIFKNKEKLRKTKSIKENILIILDFLIEKESVIGYILRESIL